MIELKDIRKSYKTGSFVQTALGGVSICFRANEFVAVLGPSGSGKTTLLNILGGLDHSDGGDIIINGTSTSKYKSSDWDTYRNHRIGFIFQSYNLIPHQSILSNVELALTLSGVSRSERRTRATSALEKVGLGEHIHKRPNQLSGGQMQRVAIARALVNDPDIVLADEPTGALDTETGVQVMDLLSEIARDRLVIMVTHNPELAEQYATRIVRLSDGQITDDSNPLTPEEEAAEAAAVAGPTGESHRKASMSFLTALSLSFNNLMTKKGRTFMTAFAGSIGIIGIAAILALSNGVNGYIAKVEEDTLSSYPLSITQSSYDLSSLLTGSSGSSDDGDDGSSGGSMFSMGSASSGASSDVSTTDAIPEATMVTDMFAQIKNNDLRSFKSFIESGDSPLYDYVNTVKYDYGVTPQIFKDGTTDKVVQLNPSSMDNMMSNSMNSSSAFGSSALMNTSAFSEMIEDQSLLNSQYDVVAGHWPENYDECVLVLSKSGKISDYTLYNIGVLDPQQLADMTQSALKAEKVTVPKVDANFTYDDALNTTFKVVSSANMYTYNADHNTWTDMSDDTAFMNNLVAGGTTLKIVGVVQPDATTSSPALSTGVAYTHDLTKYLMDQAASTDIVKQQLANPTVDVFTGKTFDELKSEQGGALDFSSMFTVDEDALQNAFQFDTSALESAGNIDASSLSGAVDTSSLNNLMQNMPMPDFSSLAVASGTQSGATAAPTLTDAQQKQVSQLSNSLMTGYIAYMAKNGGITQTTDYAATFQAYLASDTTAQKNVAAIGAIVGGATTTQMQTQMQTAVQKAMQSYMTNTFAPYMQKVMQQMIQQMATAMASAMTQQMSALSGNLSNAMTVDTNAFANAIQFNMTQDDLTSLLTSYANASQLTYDNDLKKLGYAEEGNPKSISLYPKDFANKDKVLGVIDDYNAQMQAQGKDDQVISYSDIMGTLISSVTDIINMISLVLIAFVSISLVVSSIMIGIITYISVLERKKEIGILRAMGASKRNIANVFNAETVIEGLIAGVFAILVVVLVSIPVNYVVLSVYQVPNIMSLPWQDGAVLIAISVLLTFIAGLIPSSAASRRDPVEALRSE